jgi:hypothetical protein
MKCLYPFRSLKLNLWLVFSGAFLMFLPGCESNGSKYTKSAADTSIISTPAKSANYTVLKADKSETTGKAQIKIMAYLTGDFKDKSELETTLYHIYEAYRHEGGYIYFNEPTVVGIYLFETRKLAETDATAWLGMLQKGPHDSNPDVSFNRLRLNASLGLKDNILSEDEIQLAKIKKLLLPRGIDMCDLYQTVNDIELNSIHAADKLYPDYGLEHNDYSDKLIRQEVKKLGRKYKLTSDEIDRACFFASTYCK